MKNSNRGEIITILTLATLVVIGLSTVVSTVFLKNNKQTTSTRAEGWKCPGGDCDKCGSEGPWVRESGCQQFNVEHKGDAPAMKTNPTGRDPRECGGFSFQCSPAGQGSCSDDGCVNNDPKAPYGLRGDYAVTPTSVPPRVPTSAVPTLTPPTIPAEAPLVLEADNDESCIARGCKKAPCSISYDKINNRIISVKCTADESVTPEPINPYNDCMLRCGRTSCPECEGLEGDPRLSNGNFPTPIPTATPTPPMFNGFIYNAETNKCESRRCNAKATEGCYGSNDRGKCESDHGILPTIAAPVPVITSAPADASIKIPQPRDWVCDLKPGTLKTILGQGPPPGEASNCQKVEPKADGSGNFIIQGYEYHPNVSQIACSLGWFGLLVNCYFIH